MKIHDIERIIEPTIKHFDTVKKALDAISSDPRMKTHRAEMERAREMARQLAAGPSLYELLFPA